MIWRFTLAILFGWLTYVEIAWLMGLDFHWLLKILAFVVLGQWPPSFALYFLVTAFLGDTDD